MKPAHLIIIILLFYGISNAQGTINNNTKNKEGEMLTIQKNKEVIRNLYEQSLNKRNMELLKDFVSEEYVGIRDKGVAGFIEPIMPLIKAFPDIQWKLEELIGEGNKVVVKWKLEGTHQERFNNFAATGTKVSNDGMAICELKDGKVIKVRVQTDRLGFLQQLEVLPLDLSLLSNKKSNKNKVSFIDKFFVPAAAKKEFHERMSINRSFIKNLPGFLEDVVYEYSDDNGDLICITIAQWENREAFNEAKQAVQTEYKKQGFDAGEMFKRLNIVADRGVYTELKN